MQKVKSHFLEVLITAFLFVSCILPHEYWNNMWILIAAVGFLGIYIFSVCAGLRPGFDLRKISPALLVFCLFGILSLFITVAPEDSLRVGSLRFSCIIFCILIHMLINTRALVRMFVTVMLLGVFCSALWGIYCYMNGIAVRLDFVDISMSQGFARLFATMDNPNNYAEFLVMILPFGFAYVISAANDVKRLFVGILTAVGFVALVLTSSRGAYLCLVMASALFVLLSKKRLIPLIVLLFLALIPFIPDSIVARVLTIGKDSSSTFRLEIWEGAMRTLSKNWLYGIGMGIEPFRRVFSQYAIGMTAAAAHSHNLMLQMWLELGIGGFIAFVVLQYNTIRAGISACMKSKPGELKYFLAASVSAVVGILVFGFAEYIWFYPRIMLYFWVVQGLTLALVNIYKEETAEAGAQN